MNEHQKRRLLIWGFYMVLLCLQIFLVLLLFIEMNRKAQTLASNKSFFCMILLFDSTAIGNPAEIDSFPHKPAGAS